MHRKLVPVVIGLVLSASALYLELTSGTPVHAFVSRLQHMAYDLRLGALAASSGRRASPVVVVDVDEESLRVEGHWPWPRDKLALLTQQLFAQGATVVAFDVLFAEPDPNIALVLSKKLASDTPNRAVVAKYLQTVAPDFEYDKLFSEQLSAGETVLGFLLHNQLSRSVGNLTQSRTVFVDHEVGIPIMQRYITSIPVLQKAARTTGFATTLPDDDGVIRRSPLLLRYQGSVYSALALEAVRLYLLVDNISLKTEVIGGHHVPMAVQLGSTFIPTDGAAQMLVPFKGPMRSFPYYSVTDVVHGNVPTDALKGKLVFVGTSAFGLGDVHTTPLQSTTYPGVEVHANIADAILSQHFLYTPAWSKGAEVALLVAVGVLSSMIFPFLAALWMLAISLAAVVGLLGVSTALWLSAGWVLPEPVVPMTLILALVILNMAYGFLFEGRRRKQLKMMFGRYVPDTHVDKMLSASGQFDVEGKTKEMTVLFADIQDFTSLSEHLDAGRVKHLLNAVFTPLTKIIFEQSGTIDKYIGDMVMAFWGAPLPDEQHAQHAVNAALSMQKVIVAMQPEWTSAGLPPIQLGIGINTGSMHVGDMGSEYRLAYTVLGDCVNVASRLEQLTRYYQVDIVTTGATLEKLEGIVWRQLDRVCVKGKEDFVDVYQPLCYQQDADEALLALVEQHQQGMGAYFQQDWDKAEQIFKMLATRFSKSDNYVYSIYLNRIAQFRSNGVLVEWDGATVMTTK